MLHYDFIAITERNVITNKTTPENILKASYKYLAAAIIA